MRPLKSYELLSVIAFLIILGACAWYLITAHRLFGHIEVSTHGQIARALGIGVGILLALGLNIAFIILARRQTAAEENEDKSGSSDPFNHE